MLKLLRKIIVFTVFAALIYFARYGIRYVFPLDYYEIITESAYEYNLDTAFVCAVIHTESRFNANAVSQKDASGLMQLTKQTADWAAEELALETYDYNEILDPYLNIKLGTWYLSRLIKQYNGNTTLALAAYNGGSGNVSRWLKDEVLSPDGENLTTIPFQETADYIVRVNRTHKVYNILLFFKDFIY